MRTLFLILSFLHFLFCVQILYGESCKASELSEIDIVQKFKEPRKRFLLSIDGGGLKGYIPASVLETLEGALEKALTVGDAPKPDVRIGEVFDSIIGTSIGGIISLGIRTPDIDGRPRKAGALKRFLLIMEK